MLVFADTHYMMALAARDAEGAARLLASARDFAAGPGTEAAVMRGLSSRMSGI